VPAIDVKASAIFDIDGREFTLLLSRITTLLCCARSKKIMFLGSKMRPVCRADNLAAICESIVYTCVNRE
jgi:hypothetical protein